ncbi:hypothetical protein POPTR_015G006700v4 [Populus trichocarpa]|uniref:Uncharacterized protein n=3 Tax=Populus trichocarpa TaxID=3694 RepID=A0ACC0RVB4_POPTR|nr:uncharacterized protein LOC7464522 isoform X1 [Populus trichocarpa]KAI5561708.1 hypothetical protein BDE02_15G005900 [Populus trichocarpa]KAI5561712.1 hypothetical protein BDE02_15G005900 [Populus trichocarpa]KAI9380775.1 hypothetical protein POPTR_015G006700v4 [Populus trichocarpa]KAI9380776.1 hypothetical protein POPTR_015G006700v4 [Populus trichocarpa]
MEATAGVAAASRGGSLSRKEWRAVTEQQHRNGGGGDENLEQSKLGQSDERTIYEVQHRRGPADVDFCSITVDEGLDDDILQQRIHSIARQREELQQLETELRAQVIARSEIMEMQNRFHAQIQEHEDAAAKLQEQLHERGQTIHDLDRRMEEKDRELHAIKLDNEAAWAKEDLLREQNKELATFRRERDHSEAERAQHIQQLRDLQEHIQDKERQILELQEQHRADQETIYLKDEQLKVWIARVQEMDALQSNANHSLQAELRERTEQYNQLWLGCQRQFAEMERIHMHTIQQLQLELADARGRSGSYTDESHLSQSNPKDVSSFSQNNGRQLDVNGTTASNANNGALQNGNADNALSFASTVNVPNQTSHAAGVPMAPTSLLGMPTYLPSGQVAALHPFILHQQGIHHSMTSHAPQSHAGHFHSIPAMSSLPQWQNQQAVTESAQLSTQNQLASSQTDHDPMRSDVKYDYERPVNGHNFHPDYLDVHISQGAEPDPVILSSTGESQVLESIDRSYLVTPQPEQSLQEISSQFSDALRLNTLEQTIEMKDQNVLNFNNQGLEGQALTEEQASSAASASLSETSVHSVNASETTINNGTGAVSSKAFISSDQTTVVTGGKTSDNTLLDERSLLACIVRTIPAGGRIRINSTLPNRLGKMLSPLHWHDYKRKYGKLDDFVGGHPELFLIEGDYIQLREGAQEMIAATAAVAKVAAAAAAAASPYSSFLPSVAVTPMAQSHRLKKAPSIESKSSNGVNFGVAKGISNVKILSISKDSHELNRQDFDRSGVSSTQSKGSIHGTTNSIYSGKQQSRTTGAALTSRR